MPCYKQPIRPASKDEFDQWQKMGYTGTWEQYCAAKKRSEGGSIFLCGDLGEHCAECSAVGDVLCDFPVGEAKTCDRILCEAHSHIVGQNLHYCQTHYQMWQEFKDKGGVDEALRNVVALKTEK